MDEWVNKGLDERYLPIWLNQIRISLIELVAMMKPYLLVVF